VHHDVWDYDLPAQPTLARIDTGEGQRDVVIQPTKQGFVFVLDRDTGKPVWPVEERAVPQGGAEGEKLSPTQPFPTHVPALTSQTISIDDALSFPPGLRSSSCEQQFAQARNEGLFTPPSTQGTLEFPFTGGGVNWGRAAFDPVNQILYVNTSRAAHLIKLIPRADAAGFSPPPGHDFGRQQGAPFAMSRSVVTSRLGMICVKPSGTGTAALRSAFRRYITRVASSDRRSGSFMMMSRLASRAAARDGGGAVEKMNGRARWMR
jgi:quinoprotein glucose dehydrogenase